MSIILDALKKSENERRRAERPGLSDLPAAAPRAGVPGWALAVMGALGSLVVVLGLAFWFGVDRLPASGATAGAYPPAAATVTAVPALPVQRTTGTPPADGREVRPLAAESQPPVSDAGPGTPAPRQSAPEPPSGPAPANPAPRASDSAPPSASADRDLPLAADLMHEGVLSLPDLHMELHVFSDDPSRRVVFINGQRLREGDDLRSGPRVVEIVADGVVLSQDGRRFVVPRD